MIIAVDFDGTLYDGHAVNPGLIMRLRREQMNGGIVILWTCREGKMLAEALRICRENGFRPNYVNRNAPQIIKQFGHDVRKVYADVYLDDKASPVWHPGRSSWRWL